MAYPADRKYTKEHEWVMADGGSATIGITNYAQESLGDIVFVDLPKVGSEIAAGKMFGTVESVKAVSDLYAPVSGTVSAVNEQLSANPALINTDPYGGGWIFKLKLADSSQVNALKTPVQYGEQLGG